MATAHLISGLPCSGKTTYATGLRADLDAALFSLDRCITAFGWYSIDDVGHEAHVRRVLACRDLIWIAAAELLRRRVGGPAARLAEILSTQMPGGTN